MSLLFANFKASKIILHQIYERDSNKQVVVPTLSKDVITLKGQALETLNGRIVEAVGNASHSIRMEISDTGEQSCFNSVKRVLNDEKDSEFINLSTDFPIKLTAAQMSRKIPGGMVVVIKGKIGSASHPCVIIIKAERQDGFTSGVNSKGIITLDFLENLLLTPYQKFYKIGIFIKTGTNETTNDFEVYVYDHNMTLKDTNNAALYFYNGFLGLTIPVTAKFLTKQYFEYTRDFINSMPIDDGQKLDLQTGLYSYLKVDQTNIVSTKTFAEKYLEEKYRDKYLSYMTSMDFPDNAITKDLELLKNSLKQRKITFSTDVKVTAPADKFSELIEVIGTNSEGTTLRIKGKIRDQS